MERLKMKIKQQYIGRDKHSNLQLIVETEDNRYYILCHTNLLGFERINEEEFNQMINNYNQL